MNSQKRHPNVININEAEHREIKKGRHQMDLLRLGAAAGGRAIGAMHITLPPGALSFPFHAHWVNEEAIYVISGKGAARIGDAQVPVQAGDWIALPPGDEFAHQMENN